MTRVAVVGAGGIGGILAAAACEAGNDVTVCVRTPIDRLVIEHAGAAREVPVRIATAPEATGGADWVVVATKAQDTPGAAGWLRSLVGPDASVVVAQNGLDHRRRVERFLPAGTTILPALVYIAVEPVRPGHIVHHRGNRVVVPAGEPADRLAALLEGSQVEVALAPDFLTASWSKLLDNAAVNPITALTLSRMAMFDDADVRDLARGLLGEAVAVARAEGAALDHEDVDRALARYQRYNPDGGTSMLYDRLAGRPLEHEELTGAVVRRADAAGVPVPLSRAILTLLRLLDRSLRREQEVAAS
jgi:2-dehydropantoate 2-reductase